MVTINKASETTNVPYSAIRRWIKSGEFTYYVMAGTKYLINLERLVEFLDTPATVAAAPGIRRGDL
ncbi:MAG: excisionase family DNA-binding protein [Faecousia sp.]